MNNPQIWETVHLFPIRDVRVILERKLLVFVNFTTIAAYNSQGIAWTTDRLSWDGLKIIEVTDNYIRGLAWDSPQGRDVEFVVELATGRHKGGASPEKQNTSSG